MKSIKTTILGICTILGAVAVAVVALLDGDPATVPNWPAVGATVAAGLGLLAARDNDKTSEEAGAK